jgi:protein gp37
MIFVNSMSDLFHEDVPVEFIKRAFNTMKAAERHTFQLLTKRSARLSSLAEELEWPSNLWVGVSVENQRWTHRLDDLRRVPAGVRFVSAEPLLGALKLDLTGIDWVIVGGESGPVARPMQLGWARQIRDQCRANGVPFFFKQWGAHDVTGHRSTKAMTGRILDGELWNELPIRLASSR